MFFKVSGKNVALFLTAECLVKEHVFAIMIILIHFLLMKAFIELKRSIKHMPYDLWCLRCDFLAFMGK